MWRLLLAGIALFSNVALAAQQPVVQRGAAGDWDAVARALGRAGALLPDGVYKVGLPRGDLHVTVAGLAVRPTLALGSWIAMKQTGDSEVMLMGDLVLLESEIAPVLHTLGAGGIEATALHNHLLNETPRIMYVHLDARGSPVRLAAAAHTALLATGTPLGAPPSVPAAVSTTLDTAGIARILGFHGRVNGGVYQVSVPRAEHVVVDGMEVPPSMGVATAINFQPTTPGHAAITGDFALSASEVNPVIKALGSHKIAVTAVHSHMLTEVPRLFFLHYWATGNADTLAVGLRSALDRMNLPPSR